MIVTALDRSMNVVLPHEPYEISPKTKALHDTLHLADLHADSMLWPRDLLQKHDYGHVDLPKLQTARFALQNFTIVTKSPRGQNMQANSADSDNITPLAVAGHWPIKAWSSLTERALYQSRRLHNFEENSQGALRIIRTGQNMRDVMAARAEGANVVGAMLGIEGGHALDGDLANLKVLYDAGIRTVGLHHFFDNKLGGSAHGVDKAGLTDFGRAVVRRAEELGMIVDVAHSSSASIDDVLAMATRPIINTHTGLRGQCDKQRNIHDTQAAQIGKMGGLIGIGFWEWAACEATVEAIVDAIAHAVDVAGIDHVAYGSDYDGTIKSPLHAGESVALTEEMRRRGFSDEDIAKIAGGNAIRFFAENLGE